MFQLGPSTFKVVFWVHKLCTSYHLGPYPSTLASRADVAHRRCTGRQRGPNGPTTGEDDPAASTTGRHGAPAAATEKIQESPGVHCLQHSRLYIDIDVGAARVARTREVEFHPTSPV